MKKKKIKFVSKCNNCKRLTKNNVCIYSDIAHYDHRLNYCDMYKIKECIPEK